MHRMIALALVALAWFAPASIRAQPKDQNKEPTKQPAHVPTPTPPIPVPGPRPAGGAPVSSPSKYAVEMLFVDPSGATLASRVVPVTAGKTEMVVVQQGGRTISAETTVRPGAKGDCNRVDIVLRDRTIDTMGRFQKTVWQSGSEPCGPAPITLGPKAEVNLRIAIQAKK